MSASPPSDPFARNSSEYVDADEYLLRPKSNVSKKWAIIMTVLVVLILFFFISTVTLSVLLAHQFKGSSRPKNVILMISDGFGPASESFARNYAQYRSNSPFSYMLALDTIHVGASRTRSSDSFVTDSAAGATAFSCALKSYNGAIAVDEQGSPCPTVLEAAQLKGMKTGLVATSRITHATPGSFAAHVVDRNMENEIAEQEVAHVVDVMFGGGRRHFIPQSQSGSSRLDDTDLIQRAKDSGYKVSEDRAGFDAIEPVASSLPVLGLYALSDLDFELDRNPATQPSLSEMADKALKLLRDATKGSSPGFFLMIEGSRIDHAAHANDATAHYHDIMEYQATVELVKRFIDEHPDTVMVSVSDHECGGLTVGMNPDYLWYPEVLDRVTNSTAVLAAALKDFQGTPAELDAYITHVVTVNLGITDATAEEMDTIATLVVSPNSTAQTALTQHLSGMVNVRARLGWTTYGHTGVDVNLYAYGTFSRKLQGNVENTEVGTFIVEALELNLEAVNLTPKRLVGDRKTAQILDRTVDEWHH